MTTAADLWFYPSALWFAVSHLSCPCSWTVWFGLLLAPGCAIDPWVSALLLENKTLRANSVHLTKVFSVVGTLFSVGLKGAWCHLSFMGLALARVTTPICYRFVVLPGNVWAFLRFGCVAAPAVLYGGWVYTEHHQSACSNLNNPLPVLGVADLSLDMAGCEPLSAPGGDKCSSGPRRACVPYGTLRHPPALGAASEAGPSSSVTQPWNLNSSMGKGKKKRKTQSK